MKITPIILLRLCLLTLFCFNTTLAGASNKSALEQQKAENKTLLISRNFTRDSGKISSEFDDSPQGEKCHYVIRW